MKSITVLLLLLQLGGCAGSRPQGEATDLQPWVGVWRGIALIENTAEPPAEWVLHLVEKNGRLQGFVSSTGEQFERVKIADVRRRGMELYFTFGYETHRGLRAVQHHAVVRHGRKLLSVFEGSEGGRAFRGKWEARHEP